jgi:phage FluMu protein gp41
LLEEYFNPKNSFQNAEQVVKKENNKVLGMTTSACLSAWNLRRRTGAFVFDIQPPELLYCLRSLSLSRLAEMEKGQKTRASV